MLKLKELEVKVQLIRNCFEVMYHILSTEEAGKEAPRLRSYFSSTSTSILLMFISTNLCTKYQ